MMRSKNTVPANFCCPTAIVLLVVAAIASSAVAQQPAGPALPRDTAVLELSLPTGASIVMNGADYGARRRFELKPLEPGRIYEYTIMIGFRDNQLVERKVLCQGGWLVRLTVEPDTVRPEMVLQSGHALDIYSVAWSPDGRLAATGSADGTAVIWNAQTGQQLRTLRGHRSAVQSVAFSPDGRLVATGSWDNTAKVWELATGRCLHTLEGKMVWSVAFRPDGRQLATAAQNVIVWDVATGKNTAVLQQPSHNARTLAWSADGQRIVSGSMGNDGQAIVWDVQQAKPLVTLQGHSQSLQGVAFSPDGNQVATASEDKTAIVWDATTGKRLLVLSGHQDKVSSVSFSADGRTIVTGSWDKTAGFWDAQTGRRLKTFLGENPSREVNPMWAAALRSDGQQLLTGQGWPILWDAATGRVVREFKAATSIVGAVAFTPDNRQIRLAGGTGAAVWDLQTGQPRCTRIAQIDNRANAAMVNSPDALRTFFSTRDGRLLVFDHERGETIQTFQGFAKPLMAFASHAGSRWILASDMNQKEVHFLDVQTGKSESVPVHGDPVMYAAMSPDGRIAATADIRQTIVLWDVQHRKVLHSLPSESEWISNLAFSPDGKQLLAGLPNRISRWDTASWKKLSPLAFKGGEVCCVRASADGRFVMAGSWTGHAAIWEAQTGTMLRTIAAHHGMIMGVDLDRDGRRLVTASFDGTAALWDLATGDELARLVPMTEGSDWLVTTPEGLFDGSAGARQKIGYRLGHGLEVIPVDRFFQDFFRPGLLAGVWGQGRMLPESDLFRSRPPKVRILSPDKDGTADNSSMTLEVEATDEGNGVQGPWLIHNGARVLTPGQAQRRDNVVRRRFTVPLVEGENRLEVQASSADGSWESEPVVRVLRYEKALARPRLFLAAVGVSRYAQGGFRLQFARADAEALADVFRRRGGTLYEQVEVKLLVDDQATREGIRRTLTELAQKARSQDTLLLFLAGHGAMVGQRYYFITQEFRNQPDKSRDEDIRRQGMPVDELGDFLSMGAALKRMLILDTCASGAAVDLFRVASRNPFALRGDIERLSRSQGVYVVAASAATEEAKEADELGHGILTYTLLAGLKAVHRGPLERLAVQPSGPNQMVDVLEWFSFASGHVARLTKRYCGQEQNVHMAGRGGSFPVLPLVDP